MRCWYGILSLAAGRAVSRDGMAIEARGSTAATCTMRRCDRPQSAPWREDRIHAQRGSALQGECSSGADEYATEGLLRQQAPPCKESCQSHVELDVWFARINCGSDSEVADASCAAGRALNYQTGDAGEGARHQW